MKKISFAISEERIAKYPTERRDASKLMVLDRQTKDIRIEPTFSNILSYLKQGDVIVYNNTKVSKRRVFLSTVNGREHESIFLKNSLGTVWECILKKSRKLKKGDILLSKSGVQFMFMGVAGAVSLLKATVEITETFFETDGQIPIPPYLKRSAEAADEERYQTIFAEHTGSVAAPTAGLHFTEELKEQVTLKGVKLIPVSLTVGYGTFAAPTEEQIQKKKLHSEDFYLSEDTAGILDSSKKNNTRIIALGTTSLRVLESTYRPSQKTFRAGYGNTDIFLMPGDKIQSIDALITNFHLPDTSLLMLVAAFGGESFIERAYHIAIDQGLRFFSYGDCMLIV
jgi:S-adenosylmethionine:tRNA ribosyltransferase-isomerase